MPFPPEFSTSWSDFVSDWCLGVTPAFSEQTAQVALETLGRLWPDYLIGLVQGGRGIIVMAAAVDLGTILAACASLMGFAPILERLKRSNRSAWAELSVAAALVRLGYMPVLEPELNGNRLDAAIVAEGQQVFFEVVAPDRSHAVMQANKAIRELAISLRDENLGAEIEVLFNRDINPEVAGTILEFVRALPLSPDVRESPGLASVIKRAIVHPPTSPIMVDSAPGPVLGFATNIFSTEAGTTAAASVRLPMTDERVQDLIRGELHHFSREQPNILVMNTTAVPGGANWIQLIERRLQPALNRRVGAVVLFQQGFHAGRMATRQRWWVVRHPNPYNRPPESLLQSIEQLDEPD